MRIFRFVLILALASGMGARLHADLVGEDGIMTVVNDSVITRYQVLSMAGSAVDALQRQYAGDPAGYQQGYYGLITNSLELLLERQLILHDFDAQGYRMPESYLDQLVQERIRDDYGGSRATFMKTLQAEGKTFEQFRQQVRDQTIETFMRSKKIGQEIVISPYKIETYYKAHLDDYKVEDEIKLRMITLNKTGDDDTNAVSLAREIRSQIKNGASFSDMAKLYSQDSLRSEGGDRGWIERSVLRPELASAAATLPAGQVSDVIETPDAYYLMFIEDKRAAHVKSLNDVRDEIERNLRAQEQARLLKQWIARLKAKTFILEFP